MPTLSKRTKVPRQTIANWLSGQRPYNIEHVKAVADYFAVTIDQLCFGADWGFPKAAKIETYMTEINAGVFEVILKRTTK